MLTIENYPFVEAKKTQNGFPIDFDFAYFVAVRTSHTFTFFRTEKTIPVP